MGPERKSYATRTPTHKVIYSDADSPESYVRLSKQSLIYIILFQTEPPFDVPSSVLSDLNRFRLPSQLAILWLSKTYNPAEANKPSIMIVLSKSRPHALSPTHSTLTVTLLTLISLVSLIAQPVHGQRVVNTVKEKIIRGDLEVITQKFARLPKYEDRYPRIVSLQPFRDSLFVCTSTSGGLIYRISYAGKVSLYFNVSEAVQLSTGRYIDLSNRIHGGVRSVAFHPDFDKNGLFYVSLIENRNGQPDDGFNYLSRFTWVRPADSVVVEFRADPVTMAPIIDSYRQVVRIGFKVYDHPIKQLKFFGKFLYISNGDSSIQNGTTGGGQRNDALGKILRIDPLQTSDGAPYSVPEFNPFVESGEYIGEIYALGFRNPHNICFGNDGTLYSVDAGRDNAEEINIIEPGANYGWPKREGTFVHRKKGGLLTGISPLPRSDAKNGFTYPAVEVGHKGPIGAKYVGQSLAASCPVENGDSALDGTILHANFPTDGKVYYSFLSGMKAAVTKGNPNKLTKAKVYRAKLLYDPDGLNGPRQPKKIRDLRSIMRKDEPFQNATRVDMRFGVGIYGELYWTSKKNGRIYVITSTVPKSKMNIFQKLVVKNT